MVLKKRESKKAPSIPKVSNTQKRNKPSGIPNTKKNKGFALRSISAVISAVSEVGLNTSADGSTFQLPMERAPLHIPSYATNLTASLIRASIYNDYSPNSDMPNPIFIETNFTSGGVDARGNISQVLGMVIHNNIEGYINFEAGTQLRIPCNTFLKGQNPQYLEFRLVDASGRAIQCTGGWSLQVMIEWEQEVEIDYIRSRKEETDYY